MPTGSRARRPRLHAGVLALVLVLLSALAAPRSASAQSRPSKAGPRYAGWPAREPIGVPVNARRVMATVNEQEPNNTPDSANALAIGDDAVGVVDPAADFDLYAVQVPAGTTLEIEVFAQREGSALDSYIELYASDLELLAANDDYAGLDSRIRYAISESGTYYILITDLFDRGGASFTYRMRVGLAPTGPGDPTTLFAQGLQNAWSAAAAPNELYVIEQGIGVRRVSANGSTTSFATNIGIPYDVAIDGFGRVLVAGFNAQGSGIVTAINPTTNQRTTLISNIESAASITVGPDGDIWVANTAQSLILRFDPRGLPKDSIDISGTHAPPSPSNPAPLVDLAFAPSGALHYSNLIDAVYRVSGTRPERVLQVNRIGGLAFDRDGNLYFGTVDRGIVLYSPTYELLSDPFATSNMTLTGNVVFGRDVSGAMTSRLFGINLSGGTIREVNPAGVRAPGFRIGADLLQFAKTTLRPGVMGAAYADTANVADAVGVILYSIERGTLPPGVLIEPASGALMGIPQSSGTFDFTVRAEGGGRIGLQDYTIAVTRPIVVTGVAVDHLLGIPGRLTTDLERFLDLQGNRNGRFDIGDLRAHLRAQSNATAGGR